MARGAGNFLVIELSNTYVADIKGDMIWASESGSGVKFTGGTNQRRNDMRTLKMSWFWVRACGTILYHALKGREWSMISADFETETGRERWTARRCYDGLTVERWELDKPDLKAE